MKEAFATLINHALVKRENGQWVPVSEVIVLTSEPSYTAGSGQINVNREVQALRFAATDKALREIGGKLVEYADEAATLMREAGLSEQPKDAEQTPQRPPQFAEWLSALRQTRDLLTEVADGIQRNGNVSKWVDPYDKSFYSRCMSAVHALDDMISTLEAA